MDLIRQDRAKKAFELLAKSIADFPTYAGLRRLAFTAIKCLPADTSKERLISYLVELRGLAASDLIHISRCDWMIGSHLLELGRLDEAYEKLSSAVENLAKFNREEFIDCLKQLVTCSEKMGGKLR